MQEADEMSDAAQTKFARQAADLGAVFLYKEGLSVRAYNEEAYGFIHQVMACKPMRRFVKSAGEDRVVCGVPLTVEKLLDFATPDASASVHESHQTLRGGVRVRR